MHRAPRILLRASTAFILSVGEDALWASVFFSRVHAHLDTAPYLSGKLLKSSKPLDPSLEGLLFEDWETSRNGGFSSRELQIREKRERWEGDSGLWYWLSLCIPFTWSAPWALLPLLFWWKRFFFFSFTVFLLVEERWSLSQADCLKEVSVSRCWGPVWHSRSFCHPFLHLHYCS